MSTNTTSTTGAESVGSVTDQIANLLMGDEKPINKEVNARPVEDETEDLEADDTLPDESNEDEDTEVEQEEEEQAEDDGEPITWAATLGVDDKDIALDDDGNLVGFNTKVDGKTTTVSAKDLIAGWQTNKSNTRKSQELAEQRKEFEAIKNQAAQEYIKKLEAADKLTNHLKASFVKEYQQIDWNTLRIQNPGEYAAAVQDFNMRNAEIEQILSVVDVEKQELQKEQLKEQEAAFNAYLQEEAKKIVERNPTWAKPEVFKKAITEMSDFCFEAYGFTQQEFSNIQDSRMLEVVKDAMKYRKNVKEAKTKLDLPVPKFQKTKNGSAAPKSKLEKLVGAAKNSKGYQQRVAQTDAVAELLKNIK